MKNLAFILCFTVFLSGCSPNQSDKNQMYRTLHSMGFTHIKLTFSSWAVNACADDDDWGTYFTALNSSNKKVTGVVCGQFGYKYQTVRFG